MSIKRCCLTRKRHGIIEALLPRKCTFAKVFSLETIHKLRQQNTGWVGGWVDLGNGQFCWRSVPYLCWHSGWVRKSPKLCWRNRWIVPWESSDYSFTLFFMIYIVQQGLNIHGLYIHYTRSWPTRTLQIHCFGLSPNFLIFAYKIVAQSYITLL